MGSYAGQGDYAELVGLLDRLHKEVDALRRAGCQLASNEMDYRVALRIRILDERQAGTPVTIISDICRGDEHIAQLKQARDCSEAIYKASLEAINAIKLQIRVVEAQIAREYPIS